MARSSIMLKNTNFLPELFNNSQKKVIIKCFLVPCCIHLGVFWQKSKAPTPLEEKQPSTWIVAGCLTVGVTQASEKRSAFLLWTSLLPNVPNKRNGASSEKITLPHCSLDQSIYFLQKFSLSIIFFLDRKGLSAVLREAKPFLRRRRRKVRAEVQTPPFFHSWTSCWLLALQFNKQFNLDLRLTFCDQGLSF